MLVSEFQNQGGAFAQHLPVYAMTSDNGVVHRMPVTRVGHHHTVNAEDPDEYNRPVELFAYPFFWPATTEEPMIMAEVLASLASFHANSDLRVAVATDSGFHRVLSVYKLGVDNLSGQLILDLAVEPWDSLHQQIRPDEA